MKVLLVIYILFLERKKEGLREVIAGVYLITLIRLKFDCKRKSISSENLTRYASCLYNLLNKLIAICTFNHNILQTDFGM